MSDLYHNRIELNQLQENTTDSRMRKATSMMKMLVQALSPYFSQPVDNQEDIQLFLSSRNGELEPTIAYLRSYAQKNWARPFLFQNSLHHSTTGFATQNFDFLGPAYSLCASENAQQDALFTGVIEAIKNKRPTLFIHVECIPEEMTVISDLKAEAFCEILFVGKSLVKKLNIDHSVDRGKCVNTADFKGFKAFLENSNLESSYTVNNFLTVKTNATH